MTLPLPSLRRTLRHLGGALAVAAALGAAPGASAQSIASKVEQLGQITVVQVTQLMAARRDGLRDIESGRDAGTRTAAVRYGYIHPEDNPNNWGSDVVVDHPLELRKVIDSALCGC